MGWMLYGDAVCDSCGAVRLGHADRHRAIQILRAAGWHHFCGETIGGKPHEAILCKACVKEEHKRPKATPALAQDEQLAIDWGDHD